MSSGIQMVDNCIPETVVLCIDHTAPLDQRQIFIERLESILTHLNWRTHFFIVSEGLPLDMEFAHQIILALSRFLIANPLVMFHVHPVIRVGSPDRFDADRWSKILSCTRLFQQQAYEQQNEARLLILPIIEPAAGTADGHWIQAAQFFHASFAKPSVVLRGSAAPETAKRAAGQEIRFYIEPDESSGTDGLIRQLWMNSVFEDLLERIHGAADGADPLLPCRTHRVIDQRNNTVYFCFHDWRIGEPLDTLERVSASPEGIAPNRKPDACPGCISRSLCAMTANLIANNRRAEGWKAHFQLALAFSDRGQDRDAIQHAGQACDLASMDTDRAGALIIQGLCHLRMKQFGQAEQALEEAACFTDDPGLVSFYRGMVQFEWRDYIEALDRFREALESGSEAVPDVDLPYYMAVSHIHIQEYPEARSHLDRWRQTGERQATMLYYRGLCDIGEGKFGSALSELEASERAGPNQEDMGNVLFYTGFCLKELNRCDEAIPVLERAARLDPDESDIFNLLGFCFYKTARHAEAVDCFRRAIELNPRSAIDYANLATNLTEQGRTEEAITMYREALLLDPNIGFARDNLQKLLGTSDAHG